MQMNAEQAYGIAQFLIANLRDEYKTTRRVLEAVPADQLGYQPSGKCMSAGVLAAHIAGAEVMFLQSVIQGEFQRSQANEAEQLKTPADVLAYYDQVPALLDEASKLTPEQFAKIIQFFHFQLPAVVLLNINLKHTIHHRGQLSAYLRPMGAKVPAIYGGSADEPISVPAEA